MVGDGSGLCLMQTPPLMLSLCPFQTWKSFDHHSLRAGMQGKELPGLKWTDVCRESWVDALHFVSHPKGGQVAGRHG